MGILGDTHSLCLKTTDLPDRTICLSTISEVYRGDILPDLLSAEVLGALCSEELSRLVVLRCFDGDVCLLERSKKSADMCVTCFSFLCHCWGPDLFDGLSYDELESLRDGMETDRA